MANQILTLAELARKSETEQEKASERHRSWKTSTSTLLWFVYFCLVVWFHLAGLTFIFFVHLVVWFGLVLADRSSKESVQR